MNADKISEKDLANLLTQLGRVNGDKDRIRLINGLFVCRPFRCCANVPPW